HPGGSCSPQCVQSPRAPLAGTDSRYTGHTPSIPTTRPTAAHPRTRPIRTPLTLMAPSTRLRTRWSWRWGREACASACWALRRVVGIVPTEGGGELVDLPELLDLAARFLGRAVHGVIRTGLGLLDQALVLKPAQGFGEHTIADVNPVIVADELGE